MQKNAYHFPSSSSSCTTFYCLSGWVKFQLTLVIVLCKLNIAHHHLKPANTLLDGEDNRKLCDLGMAIWIEENQEISFVQMGQE